MLSPSDASLNCSKTSRSDPSEGRFRERHSGAIPIYTQLRTKWLPIPTAHQNSGPQIPSFPSSWDSFENDLMDTRTPTYDIDTDAFHPHNYIYLPSLFILFSCIGRNLPRRADLSTSSNHSRSNIATPFLVFWANTGYNLSGTGAQPYFHATDC